MFIDKKGYCILIIIILLISQNGFARKKVESSKSETIEDIIKAERDEYSYKIGFIRIIPQFKIGIYYDSNVLSSNINRVSDIVAEAGPALTEKIGIGNFALFKSYQYFSYVYYRDLENLRHYLHNINLSLITGRRSFIINAEAGSSKGIVRPTTEADIPANQLLRYYKATAKIPLFHRFVMYLFYNRNEYSFEDYYNYYSKSINEALRRRENIFSIEASLKLTAKTRIFFRTNKEVFDFVYEPIIRDYNGSQYEWGIEISGSSFFAGFVKLGYYQLIPKNPDYKSFKGLVINTMLEYKPIEVVKLKFNVIRKPQFSVFYSINDHYVQNQFSIDLIWTLTGKQAAVIGFMLGRNVYAEPHFVSPEVKLKDDYKEGRISYIYKLRKDLYLENGLSYFNRDANYELFKRKRLMFFINLRYSL